MPTVANLRQSLLVLFAIVCAILLFVGGPDLVHARSFKRAWDLGHIPAFAVWTLLLLRGWPRLATLGWVTQVVVVVLLTVSVGGAVEIAQGAVGRYPGWLDVEHDILGSLLALFFGAPGRFHLPTHWRRLAQVAILGWLLLALVPVGRAWWMNGTWSVRFRYWPISKRRLSWNAGRATLAFPLITPSSPAGGPPFASISTRPNTAVQV
ncbi:hypothetical protein [Desulfosarcina cetonica]|uniref:hypothetical protein n=1 Tax=Desulfosarcina cetonica TaxID=90730 RepID=UPI0006D11DA7|nr:hypothetical protein [Desulfosarcina cetonica]